MIDTPKVVQSPEQRTAMIHLTVPRNEIQKVMGPGLQEVNEALAAQGVKALVHPSPEDGLPGVRLRALRAGLLDRDRGGPRDAGPAESPHGGEDHLPRWLRGSRRRLGELQDWVRGQTLDPAPDLWEIYLSGPETGANPGSYRTELNQPLLE